MLCVCVCVWGVCVCVQNITVTLHKYSTYVTNQAFECASQTLRRERVFGNLIYNLFMRIEIENCYY